MSSKSKRRLRSKQTPQITRSQVTTTHTELERIEGPIPSPEVLARYDQIVPGAAERIIIQFEAETGHRRQLEQETVAARIKDTEADRRETRVGPGPDDHP